MKKLLNLCIVLVLLGVALFPCFAESVMLDAQSPQYANARYGFSLSLAPGSYEAEEAQNGDGITVRDGQGLTLLAYGTRGPGVLGQSFSQVLAEQEKSFGSVTYRRVAPRESWFVLSGYAGGEIRYVKCLYSGYVTLFLEIRYPKELKERYGALVRTASKTFRAGRAVM